MKLYDKIRSMRAINTHSHHMPDAFFEDMSIEKLLENSYVSWCGLTPGDSSESRQAYIDRVKTKSYYVWLMRAVKKLYEIEKDLEPYTWNQYSRAIKEANADPAWHKAVLSVMCSYDKVVVDAYWNPGSCGDDKLFTSTLRIDALMFGYHKDVLNHNGDSLYSLFGKTLDSLDDCVSYTDALIREKVEGGCVALKCALAYDRPIDFKKTTKAQAAKAFSSATPGNIAKFQDYLFHHICDIAAELDVPLQCHTGLGQMHGTRAINLLGAIEQHPKTKFVLFHGGFPWTDDVLALLHKFTNVYADICWLPILSPTVAEATLHAMIEVATADRICWGCDTWTAEESAGSRMAMDYVLAKVLTSKMDEGYMDQTDAIRIAKNILHDNAKSLLKL